MSEELSFRDARARRDEPRSESDGRLSDDPGESAWELADPPPTPSPPPDTDAGRGGVMDFAGLPGFGDADDEPSGPGLDIGRFVRGVWKRKLMIASIGLASTVLFVLLALMIQHKWMARCTLITQTHQDQFVLSDREPFKPQDYDLSTFVDTIKLPSSLDEAMKRSGVSVLRRTMAAAIETQIGKDSKIFAIKVTWDDPRLAATIANNVAEIFVENSRAIRRKDARETYDYYSGQLREARGEIVKINDELVAFEETHNISSLDDQVGVLVSELSRLESEYKIRVAEAGAMRAAQARIQTLMTQEPEMIVTESRYRSPLKQRLTDYQWELQQALSRYTEENPKVVKLQKQIQILEQLIAQSNDETAPENTYNLNPKREELSLRQQELVDQTKVVEAQADALRKTLDGMRTDLNGLTVNRSGYQQLSSRMGDMELLEANLVTRVEEARLAMLRNEAGFRILEQAQPPLEPEPSMRKLVAVAGVVLGGGFGLFLALVLEFFDPLVRTGRDAADITRCELVLEFQEAPDEQSALVDPTRPSQPVSALFRAFTNALSAKLGAEQWRSLAVTSVEPESGRSLVAVNLARALALKQERALLIDADLRVDAGTRPTRLCDLHRDGPGMHELLQDAASLTEALHDTPMPNLRVIGPGTTSDDTGLLLLGRREMRTLAAQLGRDDLHVIYDLPPLDCAETVIEAAAAIGNLMLVVRSAHTKRAALKDLTAALTDRGIEIRVVIVTEIPDELLSGKPTFPPRLTPRQRRRLQRQREKEERDLEINVA